MSTPNDRDPAAQEPDPTGMRALLASLPDPGPMPAEVSERITASLHQAQEHRRHGQEGMPSAAPEHARREVTRPSTVSSLESRRRTRVPHLLAAAASVAAVGIAAVVLLDQVAGDGSLGEMAAVYWNGNDRSSGSSAEVGAEPADAGSRQGRSSDSESGGSQDDVRGEPMDESGSADAQGEPAPGALATSDEATAEQFGAGSEPGDPRILAVTRPLTSETFALGVSIALDSAARADAADGESRLNALTARSCLRPTGESPTAHDWTVSAISLDGDDAVLVVASGEPDRAWALTPDCALGTEDSQILLGPVEVP